ncbi:hypothetical protein IWX49DRAFT_258563 [Phyllosticta citricarpa]|uniref:F-box domain-containing protein n=2 Tax=Phyllosticta TaxID=121621 RepID=A0ABR1LN00_9PEZI
MRPSCHSWIERVKRTCNRGGSIVPFHRGRQRRRRIAAAIENLPLELLWIVFEQLASQKVFLNLSKTSKTLRWAVEPYVYAKIAIRERGGSDSDVHRISHAQSRLLLKQLRLHPQLGKRVRQLSVMSPSCGEDPKSWCDFLPLLSKTPNLQKLDVCWQALNVLWLFRYCQRRKNAQPPSSSSPASPEGVFPHGFDFLSDLSVGPGVHKPWTVRIERLSDFIPILRLTALSKLTLHSFGLISTGKEDFQMPELSSGIRSLVLVDTTLSGFSIHFDPGRSASIPGQFIVLEPAMEPFLGAIKKLKEFTWLYNPILFSKRKFDFSTLSSDLQCHAATLERLKIDSSFFRQHQVQRIGSLECFTNLTSLTLPHGALIGERFLPLEHAFENEQTAIDVIPSMLPPMLQELIICPSEGYLEPAVRLAVWLEEKRRHESCFHAPENLWIGFRSKRYGEYTTCYISDTQETEKAFLDEMYLEEIAPMPYGDDDKFSFRSLNVTVALRVVPETFRSYVGHFMKKYHDHMRDVLEESEDSEASEDSED